MTSVYNSYLTGDERLQAIQEAEEKAKLNKLIVMLEMVEKNTEIQVEQAALKVLKENGTHDDYLYLKEAAENDGNAEKSKIGGSIISAIRTIINKIRNFITNLFHKKADENPEEEIQVSNADIQNHDNILAFWTKLKTGLSQILSGNLADGGKSILEGLIVPTLVGAGAVAGYKAMKKSQAVKMADDVNNATTEMDEKISAAEKISTIASIVFSKFRDFLDTIQSWVTGFGQRVFGSVDNLVNGANSKELTNKREEKRKISAATYAVDNAKERNASNNQITKSRQIVERDKHKLFKGKEYKQAVKDIEAERQQNGNVNGQYLDKTKTYLFTNNQGKFRKGPNGVWEQKYATGKWMPVPGNKAPIGFNKNNVEIVKKESVNIIPDFYEFMDDDFIKECGDSEICYSEFIERSDVFECIELLNNL